MYRVKQFWWHLTARPLSTQAQNDVAAILSPAQIGLFRQFSYGDQWHAYRVWRLLRDGGHQEHGLLVAALLHDVGKTRFNLAIWQRCLIVIAGVLFPKQHIAWGTEPSALSPQAFLPAWKKPFVVKENHAAWGADMAQSAETDPLTLDLIRRHQDLSADSDTPEADRLLRLLQWADNQS